jgi:hypothetical protein
MHISIFAIASNFKKKNGVKVDKFKVFKAKTTQQLKRPTCINHSAWNISSKYSRFSDSLLSSTEAPFSEQAQQSLAYVMTF